jgi:hypothetical protein
MDFIWCKTCGDIDWQDGTHKCPPIFYFEHENWGEEPQSIRARDFEDAAKKFAAIYNEDGDYTLMGNEEKVIISDGITKKTFIVSAEQAIDYYAKETS